MITTTVNIGRIRAGRRNLSRLGSTTSTPSRSLRFRFPIAYLAGHFGLIVAVIVVVVVVVVVVVIVIYIVSGLGENNIVAVIV